MKLTAAAWVSERPDEDWDVAAAAAAWVHERARDEGSTPVLVTAVFQSYGPTIDDLARRYPRTTQARDRHREAGPVLSYVPDEVQLHLAMRIAAQSSLVAVEGTLFPLEGWAAYLGAVNLRTGEQTPPLPEPLSDAVKHLRFYSNNAFSVPYGKQEAQSIVRRSAETNARASCCLGRCSRHACQIAASRTCGA